MVVMSRRRHVVAATLICAGYGMLAVADTYPLITNVNSHVPGLGLGDNVSFVWNLWWMRQAAGSWSQDFFACPLIIVPIGGRLALHTHTALAGLVSATVLSPLSAVAAYNVLLIASLALNGLAAYGLSVAITGRVLPSAVAGAMFLLAPSITQRLMGHFNFVMVWTFVVTCTAFVYWWRRPSIRGALLLGICLGLTPYVDYYYSVYELLFMAAYVAINGWNVSFAVEPRARRSIALGFMCAGALSFAVAAWINWSTRDVVEFGRVVVSISSPRNALMAGWIFFLAAVVSAWRFRVAATSCLPSDTRRRLSQMSVAFVIALVALWPLVEAGWDLWRVGDYVTQQSSLKSSPTGVDVATLVTGPPFHGLLGERIRETYNRFHMDPMEGSAWIGVVNMAVVVWALKWRRKDSDLRAWLALGSVFAVWALGPYLMLLGRNTGLLLPESLAHFTPVLNNARIPSRAMAAVAMCGAVLAAILLSRHARRSYFAASALLLFSAAELLAAPLPITRIPDPGVYKRVAEDRSAGAVLPIPFGVRDGFDEMGMLEHDALYEQTVHKHPLVGGFLARLSPRVRPWYASHEPYSTLLRLSRDQAPPEWPSCESILAGLRAANVAFVVVYRDDVNDRLEEFIATRMPLALVATDTMRSLYRVTPGPRECSGTTPAL